MIVALTNHVKERYAERIMDRDNKVEVASFIATNKDKIQTDIEKMIQYGTIIFEGTQLDGKQVKVYRNDTWVLIVDRNSNTVITLYRIDLGAGLEFDRAYVEKMVGVIRELQENEESIAFETQAETSDYKDIIEDLDKQIAGYRKAIKELEKLACGYRDTIQASSARVSAAHMETASVVNKLLSKKHF